MIARGVYDVVRGQASETIAGSRDNTDAAFVCRVYRIVPCGGRQASHADGYHVAVLLNRILNRLGERARKEEDHGVRDAQRKNIASGAPPYG